MNLLFRSNFLILLLISLACANDLNRAYQSYLNKEYDQSLLLYKSYYSQERESVDALYGIVNSYAAQGKYDDALNWCDTLLDKRPDAIMFEKKMWLLGLSNNSKAAGKLWKRSVLTTLDSEKQRAVAMSTGWGFYGCGNYRSAEEWFEIAQELRGGVDVDQALLLNTPKREATKPTGSVSLYGGPILYPGIRLTDVSGETYGYEKGSFFGGEATMTFNKKHTITVMASRFDAALQENEYVYEGDTLLAWDSVYTGSKLYGIDVDTLYYSLDTQFPGGQYNLKQRMDSLIAAGYTIDTVISFTEEYIVGVPFDDTAYYLFKADSLGEVDSVDQSGLSYDTFDSVDWVDTVHWDSTVQWSDTVRATPDPLWQNTVYVSYVLSRPAEKNITLGVGLQLFNSNMAGLERGMVIWLMNRHSTKLFDVAGNWYVTALENQTVGQGGITFMRQWKSFYAELQPVGTLQLSAKEGYEIPTFQSSVELLLQYAWKKVTLQEQLIAGGRHLTAESAGMNLVTISEKHQFSSVSKVIVKPFRKEKLSLFGILRYEKFGNVDRKIVLGGVTLVW